MGDGPLDVVVAATHFLAIDLLWDEPRVVQFLQRLSSFARHIWFDYRGTGGSDGIAADEERLLESWVEDMVTVADAAGCERVAVLQLGGPGIGPLFAATYPERTAAMVLVNTSARMRWAEDYPGGLPDQEIDRLFALDAEALITLEGVAPSLIDDAGFRRWYERAVRLGAPPEVRRRRFVAAFGTDARAVLGSVQTPTLVVSRGSRSNLVVVPGTGRRSRRDGPRRPETVQGPGSRTRPSFDVTGLGRICRRWWVRATVAG
jgi:pimeloyl-ACP methyl ester carboxylesterase